MKTIENKHSTYNLRTTEAVPKAVTAYRSISPEKSLPETLSFRDQVDLLCTNFLELMGDDLPETTEEMLSRALSYTTDLSTTANRLVLQGERALPLVDMIVELTEQDDGFSGNNIPLRLLGAAESVAIGLRENPSMELSDRIAANAKLSNVRMTRLHRFGAPADDTGDTFSDRYIKIVRDEARWLSSHTIGARAGDLFENYITCLAQYQAWTSEQDEATKVRHATIREDQPLQVRLGGSGHAFAHDIHITDREGKVVRVQCKWGPAADESRAYDSSVIKIVETGDMRLGTNADFKIALEALWHSEKLENMNYCDRMAGIYNIKKLLEGLPVARPRSVVPKIGSQALRAINRGEA